MTEVLRNAYWVTFYARHPEFPNYSLPPFELLLNSSLLYKHSFQNVIA